MSLFRNRKRKENNNMYMVQNNYNDLKTIFFNTVDDALNDVFVYDRKYDIELNEETLTNLIKSGNITKQEIINHISQELDILFENEFGE